MLEGKEAEGKIGSVGEWFVDVDAKGVVKLQLSAGSEEKGAKAGAFVEMDLVKLLELAAAKSEQKWDDALIAQIKVLLGK